MSPLTATSAPPARSVEPAIRRSASPGRSVPSVVQLSIGTGATPNSSAASTPSVALMSKVHADRPSLACACAMAPTTVMRLLPQTMVEGSSVKRCAAASNPSFRSPASTWNAAAPSEDRLTWPRPSSSASVPPMTSPSVERSRPMSAATGTCTAFRIASCGSACASACGWRSRTLALSLRRWLSSVSSVPKVKAHGPVGDSTVARAVITLRSFRCLRSIATSGTRQTLVCPACSTSTVASRNPSSRRCEVALRLRARAEACARRRNSSMRRRPPGTAPLGPAYGRLRLAGCGTDRPRRRPRPTAARRRGWRSSARGRCPRSRTGTAAARSAARGRARCAACARRAR